MSSLFIGPRGRFRIVMVTKFNLLETVFQEHMDGLGGGEQAAMDGRCELALVHP